MKMKEMKGEGVSSKEEKKKTKENLPVLRISSAHYDFDNDLLGTRLWNLDILDHNHRAFRNLSFLHFFLI